MTTYDKGITSRFLQAGTSAQNRTVQDKLRESVSLLDFGGVADGVFVTGGAASGTDNLLAMNLALAAAAALGKHVDIPGGCYYFSGGFTLPRGVHIRGSGKIHLPFFLVGQRRGTVLMINGAVAGNCITFEDGYGHAGITDMAVFNTNTNAIGAVIRIRGHLHPYMRSVEFGALRKCSGGGLVLDNSTTTNFSTLYGQFHDLTCTITNLDTVSEASIGIGLVIDGIAIPPGPANSNQFFGGVIAGRVKALLIQATGSGNGPLNTAFHGTLFEGVYNTDMEHVYVAGSARIVGLDDGSTNRYMVKLLEVKAGFDTAFHACYMELGSIPATYNDGTNGVAPLVGAVSNINSSDNKRTSFISCNYNSVFVYDTATDTEINPTYDGFRFGSREQPNCVVRNAASQSIPNNTDTRVQFGTVLSGDTAYCKWDATNKRIVIKQQGSYLITGQVTYVGWSTANTYARAKIITSQGNFVGYLGQQGTAVPISVPVSGVVKLNPGDTVELTTLQNQGGAQLLSAAVDEAFLCVVKVG